MSSKYKITIDKLKCVGSTYCIMETPDVFDLDEEKQATVLNPDGDTDERILAAAHACPMSAIIIEEKDTGKKIWPTE